MTGNIRTLIAIAAVMAATAGSVSAAEDIQSAEYQTAEGRLTVRWGQPELPAEYGRRATMELDVDGDGAISSVEAAVNLGLYSEFDHADANRDGRVTSAELSRWH